MLRKKLVSFCSIGLLVLMVGCSQSPTTQAPTTQVPTETTQSPALVHDPSVAVTDSANALELLKAGNERYVNNQGTKRDANAADRNVLKDGQKPFAVVVTCSDSRVSPELYFDQELGDIFVIRNAGNISDPATLGSIEYAVEHLKSPLVVVVGHSSCGAVTAAVKGGEYPNNLQTIVDNIKNSIGDETDVDKAIHENIDSVLEQIKADSSINNGETTIVGAYYDILDGKVTFEQ